MFFWLYIHISIIRIYFRWTETQTQPTMVTLSCPVFMIHILFLVNLVRGQFFDDYTSETEYKGKLIGTLNSYHHQESFVLF